MITNRYEIFDNFCLRTPLFPISFLNEVYHKKEISDLDFKKILRNDIFRESLYLASPTLLDQIIKWEKGGINDVKKIKKLKISILKYYVRISTRCTPFGLFASCSGGKFFDKTDLRLKKISEYKKVTHFNTFFFNNLFNHLSQNTDIQYDILYFTNSSLYKIGGCFRYIEYEFVEGEREYSIQALNYSPFLQIVIEEAKGGKKINDLTNFIINNEISYDEAKAFILELIKNQVLVSELEIKLTEKNNYENILKRVKYTNNQFKEIGKGIYNLDKKIGNPIQLYKEIIKLSNNILPNINYNKMIFHTDTFSSNDSCTINRRLKIDLLKSLRVFNKMSQGYDNGRLQDFKRRFKRRYGDKQLPLNLVLDTETGIGYGNYKYDNSSFLSNIEFETTKKRYERIIWRDTDTIIQEKLFQCISEKGYFIKLTDDDFDVFEENWEDLPDTFSSVIELYKCKNEDDYKVFMNYAGGTSAINLIGRLAHGDKDIMKQTHEIVEAEELINEDKILAEIIHLPKVSTGNILQRPQVRKFEIPYLGSSSVKLENQISLNDILVSVENNSIKLFSIKHQKEVLPRLGNAHLYNKSDLLPMYQFLCELQSQQTRENIGFNWNESLLKLPFLPRVEYENIIFSKARWKVKTKIIKDILDSQDIETSIKSWIKSKLVPNYVELVEGDQRLLIALQNLTSLKTLYNIVKNKEYFIIEEFLFSDDEYVKREGESFTNEFVISFYKKSLNK